MSQGFTTHRVLVVTDAAEPTKSLRDAIRHRAEAGDAQFRLVVLNPADRKSVV